MITVTIRQLRQADQSISELANKEFKPALSLKIARMVSAVRSEMTKFQAEWEKLLKTWGEPDPKNPGVYNVPTEKHEAFIEAQKPLFDVEVELLCSTVPVGDFGDEPLKARILADLDWFITIPAEGEAANDAPARRGKVAAVPK